MSPLSGRMSRLPYALITASVSTLTSIATSTHSQDAAPVAQVMYLLASLLLLLAATGSSVQRLRDLGRPGEHVLLLFVPLYNVYLSYLMLLSRGEPGTNAFGLDPLRPLGSGPPGERCERHDLAVAEDGRCVRCRRQDDRLLVGSLIGLCLAALCLGVGLWQHSRQHQGPEPATEATDRASR